MVLLALAWKPESMPPARASQGVANADWVAVWFLLMKVKTTMSPTAAWSVAGVYTRPAAPPTTTCASQQSGPVKHD
jgi:hypothetical protein